MNTSESLCLGGSSSDVPTSRTHHTSRRDGRRRGRGLRPHGKRGERRKTGTSKFASVQHGDTIAFFHSDTWPGTGGVLGLTKAQIEEAKKNNVKPLGGAGFAYIRGPDDAMVEVYGDMPAERFNHVHMYQEDPFCAQLWYQKHLK